MTKDDSTLKDGTSCSNFEIDKILKLKVNQENEIVNDKKKICVSFVHNKYITN